MRMAWIRSVPPTDRLRRIDVGCSEGNSPCPTQTAERPSSSWREHFSSTLIPVQAQPISGWDLFLQPLMIDFANRLINIISLIPSTWVIKSVPLQTPPVTLDFRLLNLHFTISIFNTRVWQKSRAKDFRNAGFMPWW